MAVRKRAQFIVEADVPALLFATKEAAERYLEATDVMNDVYGLAFDRTGRVYHVIPDGERALLVADERGLIDTSRLRKALERFLRSVNIEVGTDATLQDLLAQADAYCD